MRRKEGKTLSNAFSQHNKISVHVWRGLVRARQALVCDDVQGKPAVRVGRFGSRPEKHFPCKSDINPNQSSGALGPVEQPHQNPGYFTYLLAWLLGISAEYLPCFSSCKYPAKVIIPGSFLQGLRSYAFAH